MGTVGRGEVVVQGAQLSERLAGRHVRRGQLGDELFGLWTEKGHGERREKDRVRHEQVSMRLSLSVTGSRAAAGRFGTAQGWFRLHCRSHLRAAQTVEERKEGN